MNTIVMWVLILLGVMVFVSILYRVVVPTNEVHIIQKAKLSIAYGKDQEKGNVYFNFPSWMPFIGIERIILPVSNFEITLQDYEAYDKQKVPFSVDVIGFFRISDPVVAAQRISSFDELKVQLKSVLNGAIRKVLAGQEINTIMESRNIVSNDFTTEVSEQLKAWGVENVKNVELMDLRDTDDTSRIISNIMLQKTSEIDKNSRVEVANNKKEAELAEIRAQREADLEREEAERQVGEKKAQKEKAIGIAIEKQMQSIQMEAKVTKEKEMEVKSVQEVEEAKILKEKAIIEAEKEKEQEKIKAEAEASVIKTIALANLEKDKNIASGIEAKGISEAKAKREYELALVAWQMELVKIAESPKYMDYLALIKGIEAGEKVWQAKAEALKSADLKVIANSGDAQGGVNSILDIFSAKWWTSIGAMLENLKNTEIGDAIIQKLIWKEEKANIINIPPVEVKEEKGE